VVTLICGVILKGSGDVIAERIGLSSGLFGATVLAVSTSLPEMSTGIALTKPGN
jgi:cation:H+ antiporter